MGQILISVIIPVYNAEKTLVIAIESILNQSYKHLELIIVNDGSIDASADICNKYALCDNRIRVINQLNLGVSAARNRGIIEANGKYISFLDADDTIELNTYENILQIIENEAADMAIYGMSFDYFKENTYIYSKQLAVENDLVFDYVNIKEYFFHLYEKNYFSSASNKIFKTSLIRDNNIFFEMEMAILEDFKFVLDTLEYSNKVVALKDVYYHYNNDLLTSSLIKRPDIDYINNFRILDKRIRGFSLKCGMSSELDLGKINEIILRSYFIIAEIFIKSKLPTKLIYYKFSNLINTGEVQIAALSADCTGKKRMLLVQSLVKKKAVIALYILFKINDFIKVYIKGRIL